MHFNEELTNPATANSNENIPEVGDAALLKHFTVSIGMLIGISLVVELFLHLFVPGF